MSFTLYDKALKDKISNWVKDNSITITDPDETSQLFKYKADTNNDKPLQLPLIAIRRGREFQISNVNKRPLTFDAVTIEATPQHIKSLSGVPIDLPYQIDIYTRYLDQVSEYVRNFTFKLINSPMLEVLIPYNESDFIHRSKITLNPSVVDNSSIPERLITGQFYRYTLSINIDDAYMFSVPIRDTWSIDVSADNTLTTNLQVQGSIEANNILNSIIGEPITEIDASTP